MNDESIALVVINREQTPEITAFAEWELAERYYEQWSTQWTESYLCRVVAGPGKRLLVTHGPPQITGCCDNCDSIARQTEADMLDAIEGQGRDLIDNGKRVMALEQGEGTEGRARQHAGMLLVEAVQARTMAGVFKLIRERLASGVQNEYIQTTMVQRLPLWKRLYLALGMDKVDPEDAVARVESMARSHRPRRLGERCLRCGARDMKEVEARSAFQYGDGVDAVPLTATAQVFECCSCGYGDWGDRMEQAKQRAIHQHLVEQVKRLTGENRELRASGGRLHDAETVSLDPVEQGWVDEITSSSYWSPYQDGVTVYLNGSGEQVSFSVLSVTAAQLCMLAVKDLVGLAIRRAKSNRPSCAHLVGQRVNVGRTESLDIQILIGRYDVNDETKPLVELTIDEETARSLYYALRSDHALRRAIESDD